jgi:CRP-like cAMP-binding protein
MASVTDFRLLGENRILTALPLEYRERLRASWQLVTLSVGEVIQEPGQHLDYVYFPLTSIIAFVYSTEEGSSALQGIVGSDGVVGVDLFLDSDTVFHRAIVLVDGYALRIRTEALGEEPANRYPLQFLLLRYIRTLIAQISQLAVCNRFHSSEQRLCRWLLFLHDRVRSDDLRITQQSLSTVVGARRETVSAALRQLRQLGLILNTQGCVTILDRPGLEARACECYQVVEIEVGRLFPAQEKQTSSV